MSDDATKTEAPVHAAWTPEGEVKPPAQPVSEDAVISAISAGWKMRTAHRAGITPCVVTAWNYS